MPWKCSGCGNEKAYITKSGWYTNERRERVPYEMCDRCGALGTVAVPDVYWDGTEEHGLPDDPHTGKPRVFGSKAEKAQFLKAHGLQESGDKVHGSMVRSHVEAPMADSKAAVEGALAYVKSMGADRRRQEYLRIVKGR